MPGSIDSCGREGVLTCIELVRATASSNPNAIALRSRHGRMTYAETMARADALADKLTACGVGPEVPVGICLERSFDYVIATLAVSSAGGAFMPLDPAWPEERLRFVLHDAGAPVVIAPQSHGSTLMDGTCIIVSPTKDGSNAASHTRSRLSHDDLAYVIYTSGSTGAPKGVEITQGNLLNLVNWHCRTFVLSGDDRTSFVAGLGFDAAIWEIWPCLSAGASLCIPDEMERLSPEFLRRWLVDQEITVAFVPTPLVGPMISAPWPPNTALRYLLTGGDTLLAAPIEGLPFTVVNNYGPAECTVVATSGNVDPGEAPTIGQPITGVRVDILDEAGQPACAGAEGEICIGGVAVGRGYRNRPELTAARFVADPSAPVRGGRIYRTGDFARLLNDGRIAFCGRRDNQIKLRGRRIELDEICAALSRYDGVAQCTVDVRGEEGRKALVAYLVPLADRALEADALQRFLASLLPEYMIPSAFVRLAALPLSANGKIDRGALPAPSPENLLDCADGEASDLIESRLAEIVADLLGIDRVHPDDNFFLIGGHSLLGTQLVLRARDAFGVELTLRDLFQTRTLTKLAARIEDRLLETIAAANDAKAEVLAR